MTLAKGFTLVELLLALAIAALISMGTVFMFNTSLRAKEVVEEQSSSFAAMNRAMRIIEQDFIQASAYREVKDPYGDYVNPVHLNFDGLYLTRHGWTNSRFQTFERSTLQHIHYRLAEPGSELCPYLENDEENDLGGCLIRSYRPHLDDDGALNWNHQKLLRPVESIEWQFLIFNPEINASEFSFEPPLPDVSTGEQLTTLSGVQFNLTMGLGGSYVRLFQTPSPAKIAGASQ